MRLAKETAHAPAVYASAGVQGIGTGNPGYSLTAEKNFPTASGTLNAFAGVGFRANEAHAHAVAGAKFGFPNGFSIGVQHEGHATHPFVSYTKEGWIVGLYLIEGKSMGYLVGRRF